MVFTKKQKQNKKILLGIVLIVGAIFLINYLGGGGKLFAIAGVPSDLTYEQCSVAGGGITTLSASSFQITDPDGTKQKIRVNLVASGSECLDVRLRASDLDNSLRALGMDATRDIIVSAKYEEFSTTFPIRTETSLLKTNYDNTVVSNSGLKLARISFCEEKGYTGTVWAYKPITGANVRCVRPVGGMQWGQFTGASNDNFKVTFKIGDSAPVTLTRSKSSDTVDSGSTNVGAHYVQWVGGLSSADRINVPDSYDLWKVGTSWQLATDGLPSAVNDAKAPFVSCMTQAGSLFSDSKYDSCENIFINGLGSEVFLLQDLDIPEVEDWSLTSGALYITTTARPFQQFIMDLDAESVGIVKLQGKPDITSCIPDNLRLESGINKPVSFQVKNDANVNNVKFEGGVECNQGVSATFPSFQINAMETKTINTQLISNNPNIADLNYDCTLTVRDLSGVQDTCSFDGKVEFTSGIIGGCQSDSECSSGQQCRFGNCVTPSNMSGDGGACITEGQKASIGQECCAGLDKKGGFLFFKKATCEKTLPKCEDTDAHVKSKVLGEIFPKLKCDGTTLQKLSPLAQFLAYLKLILVPIVFLFELLFTPAMIGRFFKRGKGFAWLIGLILAGIVAYVLYTSFVMGLILVGILFFFQMTAGVISLFKKR